MHPIYYQYFLSGRTHCQTALRNDALYIVYNTIKYVLNRLLHGFCHIITRITPQKTSISPLQARGDMGFLYADKGDDMAKTM